MSDVRDDSSPDQTPEPDQPTSVPGTGRAELGQPEQEPETEADRQALDTIRSISRLEESN